MRVRLLHCMRVRLRNGYTRAYAQMMQHTHTHKAVTGRVEAKKLLSRRRQSNYSPVIDFTKFLMHRKTLRSSKLRVEPIITYDHLLTLRNITMSLDFFPCKNPIPYDASYVYDACSLLVKSYSKSVVAKTRGIVLVKSACGRFH